MCAVLMLGAVGCEEKTKPAIVPVEQADIPAHESWNSTVTFSDSAKLKAILWAGHIASYSTHQQTHLGDSIHVDFYDELEQHTSVLTARRGVVDDRTRDFEAHGDVVVVSDEGTVLKSERLFWNNSTRRIHTDAFVEIISPTEHIMGHGMESDQSLKNYKIFRVTGRAATNE
jgi:LPS export ABC transporter protein LptC